MVKNKDEVLIVFKTDFAAGLANQLGQRFIWLCESQENDRAAECAWSAVRASESGLTVFSRTMPYINQECIRILDSVELHHGELSQLTPWRKIEVVGATLDETVKEHVMKNFGAACRATSSGFLIERAATARPSGPRPRDS